MSRSASDLRHLVDAEVNLARLAEARGHFHSAFGHLERAHVLSQPSTVQHVRVHGLMLGFALRNGWSGETFGQLWRIAAAAVFTPLGWLPLGNTGGANVSGLRPLPIPADLQRLIDTAE